MSLASPTRSSRPRLVQVVLTVVALALFLSFVALGTWQVQRRTAKLALIERVDQRVHAAPTPIPSVAQWTDVKAATHEYLPVTVQGHWLPQKTVLTQAVTELDGGFWVLSALQQADGSQVLVNRGFIPSSERAKWLHGGDASSTAPVILHGLLRMTEPAGGFLRKNDPAQQRWYSRDVAAIATTLALPQAAPFFVDAGLPGQAQAKPTDLSAPRAGMTVIRFHNSHVVYAVTWYALALMVVAAFWYVRRHDRQRAFAGGDTRGHELPQPSRER